MKKQNEEKFPYSIQQIEILMGFLKDNYRFRRNEMTGAVEFINLKNEDMTWTPLLKADQNSITLEALLAGIEVWDKDVRRFLESSRVETYNPLREYLQNLPPWDHRERIEKLAERVPTANGYWKQDFHLWFRCMVAQWMQCDADHGNTLTPLLIGAQGDGKSTFCRLLLPPELRQYYVDRIDFANKNDAVMALSRFALINIDEYDSISIRQSAFLKHVLQKADVKSRKAYSAVMQRHKRYASFVATTNDPQPLTDPSGSRRFLCIETTGSINLQRFINYPQLYAQALCEIRKGKPTWFHPAQERRIQRQNARFQRSDILRDMFNQCFRKPEEGETAKPMTLLDILKTIKKRNSSIRIDNGNLMRLGKLLTHQGFRAYRKERERGYYVIPQEHET
ncbi:MAG: DUF3874 domain-containing protein [Prevotella sp.]|nr:DUF3874 domain-containing protein [Prevotella sp.]MBQ9650789.1 DUF3874 domain-containing protein [Prevotella sp.]